MKKKLFPAVGIIIVSIILVTLNELTEWTIIRDYAIIFIIAGMLFGVWLAKISERSNKE